MNQVRWSIRAGKVATLFLGFIAVVGCEKNSSTGKTMPMVAKLGIRPHGDETIHPDMSKIPADLQKVFTYIDSHIDEHVENLQNWIRQPGISNSGEGIPESAEMTKAFFDKLGCQQTRVYDVGITEYGSPGNPVVYARCDEGAPRTLAVYWMYDTMPVTQPDAWASPPFEAKIVDGKLVGLPAFRKVLVGRGAVNSKGPEMSQLNALMSMKAVLGKLPVNLIFIAEGDEERMDIGLRKFVIDHPELLKGADAMVGLGRGGSEGCVYVELTTSGKKWGRGPTDSDIHGSNKRAVDSPAWRHIQMLASLVSKDGNTPLIKGFFDGIEQPNVSEIAALKAQASHLDLKKAADGLGVARYISDDPFTMLKMARMGTSMNMDGIWGGNMYAGGAGAILPNKITSKHNFRYVPNMHGLDIVRKLRTQLDVNGYSDVDMKLIGDVPWAKMDGNNEISHAVDTMYDQFAVGREGRIEGESILNGGYWPAYLFTNGPTGQKLNNVSMPIDGGSVGTGGRAHAANEYWVIEGAGKRYGMAGAEQAFAALVYNFAHGSGSK